LVSGVSFLVQRSTVQKLKKSGVWLLVFGSWQLIGSQWLPASSKKREASSQNREPLNP